MKVAVVDCGSGNLRSVANALRRVAREIDAQTEVTADPEAVRAADRIVLPGVGAFAACAQGIAAQPGLGAALHRQVRERRVPFLGICVGMQLLAETGYEDEVCPGLGWLGGEVRRIPDAPGLRIPHMGWNVLVRAHPHPLLAGIEPGAHMYFVHSYRYLPERAEDVLASAEYGAPIVAAVARGNVAGTQFHPEKSQTAGLQLLANFLRWNPEPAR